MSRMTRTRARMCTGKRRHNTRQAAETHMAQMVARGANAASLKVYECRHGTGRERHFHVGHLGRRAIER